MHDPSLRAAMELADSGPAAGAPICGSLTSVALGRRRSFATNEQQPGLVDQTSVRHNAAGPLHFQITNRYACHAEKMEMA